MKLVSDRVSPLAGLALKGEIYFYRLGTRIVPLLSRSPRGAGSFIRRPVYGYYAI